MAHDVMSSDSVISRVYDMLRSYLSSGYGEGGKAEKLKQHMTDTTPFTFIDKRAVEYDFRTLEAKLAGPSETKLRLFPIEVRGQPAEFIDKLERTYAGVFLDDHIKQYLYALRRHLGSDKIEFKLVIEQDWKIQDIAFVATLAASGLPKLKVYEHFTEEAWLRFRRSRLGAIVHGFKLDEVSLLHRQINVVSALPRAQEVWETRLAMCLTFEHVGEQPTVPAPKLLGFYGERKFTEQEFIDELKQFEENQNGSH